MPLVLVTLEGFSTDGKLNHREGAKAGGTRLTDVFLSRSGQEVSCCHIK